MKQVIDKEYVKNVDSEAQKDIEEAENLAEIVGAMIRQRNSLGISQRELAAIGICVLLSGVIAVVLPKDYAISIAVVFILFIAVVAGIWLYKIQKRFS